MWSWEEVSRQDLICPAVCVPCVPGREYYSTLWIACLGCRARRPFSRGAQAGFKVWQWQKAVCLLLLGGECLIGCARYHSPRRIHV